LVKISENIFGLHNAPQTQLLEMFNLF